jgi:hypothetical protein
MQIDRNIRSRSRSHKSEILFFIFSLLIDILHNTPLHVRKPWSVMIIYMFLMCWLYVTSSISRRSLANNPASNNTPKPYAEKSYTPREHIREQEPHRTIFILARVHARALSLTPLLRHGSRPMPTLSRLTRPPPPPHYLPPPPPPHYRPPPPPSPLHHHYCPPHP